MIYYIYKITLTKGKLKDHYYIGQHKTDNINDGYKGSGQIVKDYYKKHPNDYIKEIICYCENSDELNEKEAFYVGDLYETDDMCLNLRAGGAQQGFSDEAIQKMSDAKKGITFSDEHKQNLSEAKKGENNPMYGKPGYWKGKARKKQSDAMKGENNPWYGKQGYWKGKTRPDDARKKQSESMKGKQTWHIGKHWYNNGITEAYAFDCPVGYVAGRLKRKSKIN